VRGARAATLPELTLSAQGQQRRNPVANGAVFGPRDLTLFDASFDARWEVDLFGRLGAEARAQARNAEAAALDATAIRVTVLAETGRLYFGLRALQLRLEIVTRSAAAQADLAGLARARAAAGLVAEIDAIQADGLARSAEARAADLRAQIADTVAALALIVGRTAVEIAPAVSGPATLPEGVSPLLGSPGDVLQHRYDVRRDIARLEAADAQTAARVRDRLPRLTLTATAGSSATAIGSLFTPGANLFSVVGALAAPAIDFGRRKALADQARAVADERAAIVQTTVLTAIREIERDAAAVRERGLQARLTTAELERNRTAQTLLRQRYLAGIEGFSRVLDAERQALVSADAAVTVSAAKLDATLSLWKSLGGL